MERIMTEMTANGVECSWDVVRNAWPVGGEKRTPRADEARVLCRS